MVGHLGLGVVGGLGVPSGTLLGQLLLGLQWIAATRSPVRMHINDLHAALSHAILATTSTFALAKPVSNTDELGSGGSRDPAARAATMILLPIAGPINS